jgi:hypothetical protein
MTLNTEKNEYETSGIGMKYSRIQLLLLHDLIFLSDIVIPDLTNVDNVKFLRYKFEI